ncbi:hypothetical protein GCM10009832_11190 [Dietzia kunjamensis subsp. schimae]|jgi:hypothetical protein
MPVSHARAAQKKGLDEDHVRHPQNADRQSRDGRVASEGLRDCKTPQAADCSSYVQGRDIGVSQSFGTPWGVDCQHNVEVVGNVNQISQALRGFPPDPRGVWDVMEDQSASISEQGEIVTGRPRPLAERGESRLYSSSPGRSWKHRQTPASEHER